MYKQEIQEIENGIRDLSTHNGNTIAINALKKALNELIALQEQYEAKLAKKQTELDSLLQTKQEQEKEKQEALKQAELARLLAQCSTPPPSTDLVAIKRVLESLNTLQTKLLST
ncbi:hypothetical protein [Helicobacter sp. T3_23-1059]